MNYSGKIEFYIDGPDQKTVLKSYNAIKRAGEKETRRQLKLKPVKTFNILFTTSMGGVIEGNRNPFFDEHPKNGKLDA